jgi:hypothetical protein
MSSNSSGIRRRAEIKEMKKYMEQMIVFIPELEQTLYLAVV